MENFTAKDIQQIKNHGLSVEKVHQNLKTFAEGISFVELVSPATLENLPHRQADGIRKLTEKELGFYAKKYENENLKVVKFVPASGAATRMFKLLQGFLAEFDPKKDNLDDFVKKSGFRSLNNFFEFIPKFPFYEKALKIAEDQYPNFERFSEEEKKYSLVKTLLDEDKLNFSNLPKGLVPFHKYNTEIRTAFEEHFVEAATLSTHKNPVRLEFTISEKHLEKFQKAVENIKKSPFLPFGEVRWGLQEKSTDTIAADMENHAFRDENNELVFRPAGHGALLENLNQIDADIVFIKNIDNVSTENYLPIIASHKKALAGILLEIQQKTFEFLRELEQLQHTENLEGLEEIRTFLKEQLNVRHEPKTVSELIQLLNRPIRVCGMVKNTGAPGGGPFWVKNEERNASLQIVETAQIDMENPQQKEILESSTHFNPVDLVCGVKNYKGEKFNLTQFSNPKRGFITQKSINGRDLKALELPGLWNGAMEHWNTVFVEVPLETFNPVKTVMDLLKPGHRLD